MIELHLRGQVAPGHREELLEFLAEAIPFYEEPGGIRVRVLWSLENDTDFIEVIEYADQETHDRDQVRVEDDPRMRSLLTRWRALLDGPPAVERYEVFGPPTR